MLLLTYYIDPLDCNDYNRHQKERLILCFRFKSIGVISCTITDLAEDPIPISTLMYKDFKGRTLIASALDNWPWLGVTDIEGVKKITSGIDYNILETLSEKLNFR